MIHSSVHIIKKINLLGFVRQVLAVVLSNLVLPRACLVLLHILSVHNRQVYIIVLKTGSGIIKLESFYQVFSLSRSISDMKVS